MNTLKEGIKRLEQADEAVRIVMDRRTEIRREFIEKFAPHKMGAVIVVNGYSHAGKNMRVTAVDINATNEFHYYGRVLRKDGTDSANHADSYYTLEGKPSRSRGVR